MIPKICRDIAMRYQEPVASLLETYFETNSYARAFIEREYEKRIFIDHITPRTKMSLREKAEIFTRIGYNFKCAYKYPRDGWFAHVYVFTNHQNGRRTSCHKPPVIFVDKAYSFYGKYSKAARKNPIPGWIDEFPEKNRENFLLHHIACRVSNIEEIKYAMEKDGFMFQNILTGYKGKLKQVFSKPVLLIGARSGNHVPGTVFELIYRHRSLNDWDFIKSQASDLMMKQSTLSL